MNSSSQLTAIFFIAILAFMPLRLSADDTVYTKVDVNPVPIKTPPPVYPDLMRRQNVSGVVAVSIVIDETGAVTSVEIVKSSDAVFVEPALAAVKEWKFKPAQKNGVPVKIKVTVPIRFNADD